MVYVIVGDFPTYVGMNRNELSACQSYNRFPHLCGDEPQDMEANEEYR